MHVRFPVAVALTAVLASACKGPTDPSKNTTDTFADTVNPTDAKVHTFTVGNSGEYFVNFKSLTPPLSSSSFPTGIRVTAVVGGQCVFGAQIVGDNQLAVPGKQALSGIIDKGQYCLWVYDEGFFAVPEAYVIDVSHP